MNLAQRIQDIRKKKGVSQEELADKIGVSRQAVSKWESGQSSPELDKILLLSEYLDVTTDKLLKGTPPEIPAQSNTHLTGQILRVASTAFLAIGLLFAFLWWYEKPSNAAIWGGMILQVVGIAAYGIAKIFSKEQPPFLLRFLNVSISLFMPVSMAVSLVFRHFLTPYPTDIFDTIAFLFVYGVAVAAAFLIVKKQTK